MKRSATSAVRRRSGLTGVARAVWFLAIVVTFLTLGIPFPGPLQVAAIFAAVGAAVVSGGASFD